VNGVLPSVGISDYALSDGDDIVMYYTEDWTQDPSAMQYMDSDTGTNGGDGTTGGDGAVEETAASVTETTVTGEGKEIADELTALLAGREADDAEGAKGTEGVEAAENTGLKISDTTGGVKAAAEDLAAEEDLKPDDAAVTAALESAAWTPRARPSVSSTSRTWTCRSPAWRPRRMRTARPWRRASPWTSRRRCRSSPPPPGAATRPS
jgi:hypothetical protein